MVTRMSMTNPKPLLAALLSEKNAANFLANNWPHSPYITQTDPATFPKFLRSPELSSTQALADCYRGNLRFTHGRKSDKMIQIDRVDPATLSEMGLTLQFEDITPYVPGAAEFVRGVERELGLHEGSITMSAFSSPQQDGLGCHYDAQDLISIQLQGNKRFHYAPVREIAMPYGSQYVSGGRPYDELFAQAQNGFPNDAGVKFKVADMQPGSVLFLPRGTWHYTEAKEPSLSLSLMINSPTLVDCAVEQLRWLLLQDSAWREPLYGATTNGTQHEKLRAHTEKLLARLPQQVTCLSADDIINAPIPVAERLDNINTGTRFQTIPDARLEFDSSPSPQGMVVVTIVLGHADSTSRASARMEITEALLTVFHWIAQRRTPFTAGEVQDAFPGLAFNELSQLLTVLTRAQFIKMFWFAELAKQTRVGD